MRLTVRFLVLAVLAIPAHRGSAALGEPSAVIFNPTTGSFPLVADGAAAPLLVDARDWAGVARVARDFQADVERVTGKKPTLKNKAASVRAVVIIGTVGKSEFVDALARAGKIDLSSIEGRWESWLTQVVENPFPGVELGLVIAGSDKRGTIYGVYNLSEQIGVSPWYWWADVPAMRRSQIFVKPGRVVHGPPAVKYRGIFLNDEAPALTNWVRAKFGDAKESVDPRVPAGVANYGRDFYARIFEVLLRLRGNYLWPAMWGNAFNEDDPTNAALADDYGIVMGTSHQEPMLRAQQEWDRGPGRVHGRWDYSKPSHQSALPQFWREGIRRNRNFESIITLGLRAENDSGQAVGKDLTEQIVSVQRKILAEEMNPDLTKIPQVWCLYKEVQHYYDAGMRVPDDVTTLWADDNWGNLRRLPNAGERQRSGGAGVYYHFDYHGGPRSYQWINTSPIPKVWDQMSLAKRYGADRIWIVNVGHFNKSGEFPLEFFLRLAWDTTRWTHENLDDYTREWATREFGENHSAEIAQLITSYTRFNGRRKPELLDADTYSLLNYREYETVVADYAMLAARAQTVFDQLPAARRDAFYGLVQFPIKACAQLHALYFAAARNALHVAQRRASANDLAAETRSLFRLQTDLMDHFNRSFVEGKWEHTMDQAYIGYTSWNPPQRNNLDAVKLKEIELPASAAMGVAVEGALKETTRKLAFHKFGQGERFVEVFNRGKGVFNFTVSADSPWIVASESRGTVEKDRRFQVQIDWSKAPAGDSRGEIKISGAGTEVTLEITAHNPAVPAGESIEGFVEGDGYVSIEAEHYLRKTDAGLNRWIKIQNYGHTISGMRTDGPSDVEATPQKDSPCLEYEMYLFSSGEVEVESIVGPTLSFIAGRPLRFAVSFDNDAPREITVVPAVFDGNYSNPAWSTSVKNNCHRIKSRHSIARPGLHTLKIWMIDPAVVLQKIVVNTGGVLPSYLGPPESAFLKQRSAGVTTSELRFFGDSLAGSVDHGRSLPGH
ncbi:MAG TPA: glycosyl hydrolase 115 family protein [Opitutaceae bacterium]|nr:glycosyl hydrolase 115 family protein [Opitutaceae bacterium]